MGIIEVMKMMNSVPAGIARHDRRDLRRQRAARSSTASRSSACSRMTRIDRHRRHHDARRQPEPVGRDRPDDAATCWPSRRRWSASASTRSTSRRARTWPCRCATTARTRGSGSGRQRGDAATRRSASSRPACASSRGEPCDEDVMALAFRCVVRNGIRRLQIADPANDPDAPRASPRWPARRASRRSWSGSPTRSAPCTRTPTTPSGPRRSRTAATSTACTSRTRAGC